jgi:hypothetical protein
MSNPTPEERARTFAARWFKNQSHELQEIGRREIAALIREAIEAENAAARSLTRPAVTPSVATPFGKPSGGCGGSGSH